MYQDSGSAGQSPHQTLGYPKMFTASTHLKSSVIPSFAFLSHLLYPVQTPIVYNKRQNLLILWTAYQNPHRVGEPQLGQLHKVKQQLLGEQPCPPLDEAEPGRTAASLHGTLRAPHQRARSAPTQLATMSPRASIQPGFLQFHPMLCFFFPSVGCCKIQPSFHLFRRRIEFIPWVSHRVPGPQNPSVTAFFLRQDYTSSPFTYNTSCAAPGCKLLSSHQQGPCYNPSESLQGFSYERSKFSARVQTSFTDPENTLSAPAGPFCRHSAQRGDSRESSVLETLWNVNTSEWLFFSFHRKLGAGWGRKRSSLLSWMPDKII